MSFQSVKLFTLFFCAILMMLPFEVASQNVLEEDLSLNTVEGDSAFVDLVVNVKDESEGTSVAQTIRFHYQEKRTVVECDYRDNAEALNMLDQLFTSHPADNITYIVIMGSLSLEGSSRANDRVAKQRVVFVKNYILENYPGLYDGRIVTIPHEPDKKPFFIAVKNNLLYDVALLPNLSLEIPFGRGYKWSAVIEGNWSWWNTEANKYNYHRIQMAGVEVRRWFGNRTGNPLNGWYAGLYGYGGDYDIRLFADKNSDIGQQSLWSYSAGLTFGYVMPIGRRFNLEFGLGAGYLGGTYRKYNVSDCRDGVFPLLSTHRRNYFGVTKASVSLVWLIGSGVNLYNRKGVAR